MDVVLRVGVGGWGMNVEGWGIGRLIHNRWDVERSGGLGFRFIAMR